MGTGSLLSDGGDGTFDGDREHGGWLVLVEKKRFFGSSLVSCEDFCVGSTTKIEIVRLWTNVVVLCMKVLSKNKQNLLVVVVVVVVIVIVLPVVVREKDRKDLLARLL